MFRYGSFGVAVDIWVSIAFTASQEAQGRLMFCF